MDSANACFRESLVSTGGANCTNEDERRVVSIDQDMSDGPKSEWRSRVQALHTQLERITGNPSMNKRRKAKARASDALATRLRSAKRASFRGGFGDNTFDISIQDKVRAWALLTLEQCSRISLYKERLLVIKHWIGLHSDMTPHLPVHVGLIASRF